MKKILPILYSILGTILVLASAEAQDEKAFLHAMSAARELLPAEPDSAAHFASEAIEEAADIAQRAEARELRAEALQLGGNLAAARNEYRLLLRQARESADAQLRGRALNGMGTIEFRFGNYDRALARHNEAHRVFDSLGNTLGAAQSLHDMALVLAAAGRRIDAMQMHRRALAMREEEQFRQGIAESHNSIGVLYWQEGRPDSALAHLRKALQLRKQLGVLSAGVAATLDNIGRVYLSKGEPARALDFHREALGFSRHLGDARTAAATMCAMGAAYTDLRQFDLAREILADALRSTRRLKLGPLYSDILLRQSKLEEKAGNTSAALTLLRQHMAAEDSLRQADLLARVDGAVESDDSPRFSPGEDDGNSTSGSDFRLFLIVVIGLLVVIVVIALSALRLRGRTNAELSGKNVEIERMNAELQRLNLDLARSEEMYRLLFEHLPVGVFLYDQNMTLVQVNNAFADIIGSPVEQLEGLRLDTLRDRRIIPALQSAINGKMGAYEGEYLATTNNNTLQVSMRTAPLQYRDLPMPHGIGFVLEISNWKRIERDLIESREIAVQADRLKNAFLTNISHEIRTPLNIIMGYFGILHQDMKDRIDEEEADYFLKVDLAVRRLLRTVDQILTLSILESGSYAMNVEQCHLHDLARELFEELQPLAAEKGLDVEFESSCRDVYINVDKYSVGQALRNLLDNAVKFTDAGAIHISLQGGSSHLSVVVRDTGIGMSGDYVQQLFEAFSQEDSGYSRSYEGLGLGLRLTKRYLDVNGGSIHVQSEKGEGTTFTVTFPVAHHYAHPTPVTTADHRERDGDFPRRTLLVVEDDHETQKFLQLILAGAFDLHFADSADNAWETLHDTPVDLVLMDISLRGDEDGLQLTGRIRQDPQLRDLPVIAVTAHAFADDRRRSLEAGCNEYLPKPFRVNQLRDLVDRFLQ